ncbi:uncharacterized protein LOC135139620 [Zophobas morio]|uniref:uncharacterized protein LOC135139620 n=1 Tax=Zophobas morio TaxID=2755281 RepID=UPI0030834704
MRYFVAICCVLASVAAKDKKISLDDIERDNLRGNKSPRTVPVQKLSTTYGFLPAKTATDYARQQPKYVQYVPPPAPQQQYTPPPQQYSVPQQYYYQPTNQPTLYDQYANLQYVSDNSVAQQQYYTPQYVYLQQYSAPSTAVQSVVDPKGGIQYVMYVPQYAPKAEQTQNYESVIYANDQQSFVLPETQYVASQQPEVTPSIKYVPEKTPVYKQEVPIFKQEPKSLLDSYVPSILQVQYYKQQQAQAQANAIQQSLKEVSSTVSGKSDYVKSSYRPTQTQHNSAESITNYSYQIPSTQQKYN